MRGCRSSPTLPTSTRARTPRCKRRCCRYGIRARSDGCSASPPMRLSSSACPTDPPPTSSASAGGAGPPAPPASGRALIAAADLPAGRAVRFTDDSGGPAWLLHEPNGDFRAFSAVCTHAGCSVDVSGGQFICPCHGGTYSAQTGAVTGGPPPSPLQALKVQVVNGQVRLL